MIFKQDVAGIYTLYEVFHNFYGGGEPLRDITLTEYSTIEKRNT